jgi:hypothetical protein
MRQIMFQKGGQTINSVRLLLEIPSIESLARWRRSRFLTPKKTIARTIDTSVYDHSSARTTLASSIASDAEVTDVQRRKHKEPNRPTLDDVQRISEGRAAKTRGWGSRQVPHRLNAEERKQYDLARQRNYLSLRGSGYRRERKGSPLANIWRQLNDALARPCIVVEQSPAGNADVVLVDLSPLRCIGGSKDGGLSTESAAAAAETAARELADSLGLACLQDGEAASPFTVIVPHGILALQSSDWTQNVADGIEDSIEHVLRAPIWQQPPRLVCFRADRSQGKALAKALAERLCADMA